MGGLIVLSGGMDSFVAGHLAREKGLGPFHALTFGYGQKHRIETAYAVELAERLGVESHQFMDIRAVLEMGRSNTLTGRVEEQDDRGDGAPSTFVEGRNTLLITASAIYARSLGASEIVVGIHGADADYPDCRAVFLEAMRRVLELGFGGNLTLFAPLLGMTKADVFRTALRLGVLEQVIEETLTCYRGVEELHAWGRGCGECYACRGRMKAYAEMSHEIQSR